MRNLWVYTFCLISYSSFGQNQGNENTFKWCVESNEFYSIVFSNRLYLDTATFYVSEIDSQITYVININEQGEDISSKIVFSELQNTKLDSFSFTAYWRTEEALDSFIIHIILFSHPNQPELLSPRNGELISWECCQEFIWTSKYHEGYLFQLSEDSTFASVYFEAVVEDTFYLFGYPFQEDREYFWRVKNLGLCSHQVSEIFQFVSDFTNKIGDGNLADLTVYPNPTTGVLHFSGGTYIEGSQVLIHDATGRVVDKQRIGQGRLSIEEFPAGYYFLRLLSQNNSKMIKILKW